MVSFNNDHNPKDNGLDLSPLVRDRAMRVSRIDEDGDGAADVFAYDLNDDGIFDVTHRLADRRTVVSVPQEPCYAAPASLTHYTGMPSEPALRVTFRVRRVDAVTFELNGCPVVACVDSHGMRSIGQLWDADREHRDEVQAARMFWLLHGGVGGLERIEGTVR